MRLARVGERQRVGLARNVGGLFDPSGLHAQLYPYGLQRRGIRRDDGGGVRLGNGAVPLLGATQQAGKHAAVIGAYRVGVHQLFQHGDRQFQAAGSHQRRHQQAAHVAPAVLDPRQRGAERGQGRRGGRPPAIAAG
ncbi:hypothetical protein DDE05_06670 [Streptomyces cavourensis]|nr:hypothetical protein DDE05_06670 [Streptomyces cavourensis]